MVQGVAFFTSNSPEGFGLMPRRRYSGGRGILVGASVGVVPVQPRGSVVRGEDRNEVADRRQACAFPGHANRFADSRPRTGLRRELRQGLRTGGSHDGEDDGVEPVGDPGELSDDRIPFREGRCVAFFGDFDDPVRDGLREVGVVRDRGDEGGVLR
jgi:hypothetical protein